jgi:hypothetical protein
MCRSTAADGSSTLGAGRRRMQAPDPRRKIMTGRRAGERHETLIAFLYHKGSRTVDSARSKKSGFPKGNPLEG